MAKPKKTVVKESEVTPAAEVTTAAAPIPASKQVAGAGAKFSLKELTRKRKEASILAKQAGKKAGFKSAAEINSDYLPVDSMLLQYLMGQRGIIVNTITEIIGQENTGKSSLIFTLLGGFARNNMPCLYINSEPKMLETAWLKRLMGGTQEQAEELLESITVVNEWTLDNMDKRVREWVQEMRVENAVPNSVPLVIVIDSVSKLLNPEEEEVLLNSKAGDAELAKSVSDVSKKPGVTAKWMHSWTRAITPLLQSHNVTILAVSGQNMNMNAGSATMAPDGGASLNKTRVGGTAMNQSTALQITITKKGLLKDSKSRQIGHIIRARCVKNSYGATRDITYNLRNDYFDDLGGVLDAAIDMKESFCDLLVTEGVFGLSCVRKRYSSAKLGLESVTHQTLYDTIMSNPEWVNHIGVRFKIQGYENVDSTVS